MNVSRSLTLAATAALSMTTLAVAPASAGGPPVPGTVGVDRLASLDAEGVTVHGTYACTVPDGTVASRPGTIGVELVSRSGASTSGTVAVACDGTTRPWTIPAPSGSLRPGQLWLHGYLEVPDTAGSTPWNLFDAAVTVVGRR